MGNTLGEIMKTHQFILALVNNYISDKYRSRLESFTFEIQASGRIQVEIQHSNGQSIEFLEVGIRGISDRKWTKL